MPKTYSTYWIAYVANNAGNDLLVTSTTNPSDGNSWSPVVQPTGNRKSKTAPAIAVTQSYSLN
jgi:hypothetical protein